jgi:hypothetical protein
MVSYFVKDYKI